MSKVTVNMSWNEFAKAMGVQDPNDKSEQLGVEVRHQMVDTFVNRYLKGVANESIVYNAAATVRQIVHGKIKELVGEVKGGQYDKDSGTYKTLFVPSDEMKAAVDDLVKESVGKLVSDSMKEYGSFRDIRTECNQALKKNDEDLRTWIAGRVAIATDDWVQKTVDCEIKKIVDIAVKEKISAAMSSIGVAS
ncbi:hypothetical protein [Armatimonas sp.]|uniref:hypothetical protein n=1 Tax=Armatimonas sp. TaxID=1872638 RepID=UPI00286B326A|nr:hypothetical protein [Armatimonas sp.]